MQTDNYLHEQKDIPRLNSSIQRAAHSSAIDRERLLDRALLYGLAKQGFIFELKRWYIAFKGIPDD